MTELEFSVVMPVFNEEKLIATTVEHLLQVLAQEEGAYEVVLVDDGSTDGSWNVICGLANTHPQVTGVRFTRNFGHQAALLAGLSHASGQAVVSMDSDGEHPVALVPQLLQRWRCGVKVVQTLREESRNLSRTKRMTSRWFYRIFSWLAGTTVHSGAADFRLLDRSVVDVVLTHPNASGFLRGFVPWTGFATEYVPYSQGTRTVGVSKFTGARMIALAREGIVGFSVKPLRLSMLLGIITCLLAVVGLVCTTAMCFISSQTEGQEWTLLASFLAMIGGAQLIAMGILGEYIAVIFQSIRGAPPFLVDQVERGIQSSQIDS